VQLVGADAYFHLRFTKAVLEGYPVVPRVDGLTNFPRGEMGVNQGFFDVTLATAVLLSGRNLSPSAVVAWYSPICFLVIGTLIYLWLRREGRATEGGLFLFLLILYPGPLSFVAALGYGDHHAAEVLLALLVAGSLSWLLQPEIPWGRAPLGALALFFFSLCWPGAPLHLLAVGLVLYAVAWFHPAEESDRSLALKGSVYGLTLLALVLGSSWLCPWSVMSKESQTAFVAGSCALFLGYPLLIWVARQPWRLRLFLAVGVLALSLAVLSTIPAVSQGMNELFGVRSIQVGEHVPISLSLTYQWYGLTPLLAILGLRIVLKKSDTLTSSLRAPLLYGAFLVGMWLQTRDFAYYVPPLAAVLAALALGSLGTSHLRQALLAAVVIAPVAFGGVNRPWSDAAKLEASILGTRGLRATCGYLKKLPGADKDRAWGLFAPWDIGNALAELSGVPVARSQAPSSMMSQLLYHNRPERAYEALTYSEARPFRYIVLPARNLSEKFLGEMVAADLSLQEMFVPGEVVRWQDKSIQLPAPSQRHLDSLLYRLYWGSAESLGNYRLVYETSQQVLHVVTLSDAGRLEFQSWPISPESPPELRALFENPDKPAATPRGVVLRARQGAEVRVFELVQGALLQGRAVPMSDISASLELYAPSSQRRWYGTWRTRADAAGDYQLRLPYATAGGSAPAEAVRPEGPYWLDLGARKALLHVTEAEVLGGLKVVTPAVGVPNHRTQQMRPVW
jgi:hypothetical protein